MHKAGLENRTPAAKHSWDVNNGSRWGADSLLWCFSSAVTVSFRASTIPERCSACSENSSSSTEFSKCTKNTKHLHIIVKILQLHGRSWASTEGDDQISFVPSSRWKQTRVLWVSLYYFFFNIRRHRYNVFSVAQNLFSKVHNFLIETHKCLKVPTFPYIYCFELLYPQFRFKTGCSVYVSNSTYSGVPILNH